MTAVLHKHRALVGTATDPWEITAALEAQGMTDADARRLRHRDVFGLADELFARAPGARTAVAATVPVSTDTGTGTGAPAVPAPQERDASAALPAALPYVLPAVAVALVPRSLAAAALVVIAFAVTRRGPLRAAPGGSGRATAGWTCVLLALTLGHADRAALTALALSLVPAALCAHWFAGRARARLARSRGLADFAAALRPRLAAALAGYAAALLTLLLPLALLAPPPDRRPPGALAALAAPACLGVLLFAGRLAAVHGRPPGAAPAVLAAACAAQGLYALAALLGLAPAAGPGADTVRAAVCAAAALALLARALRTLTRPSAYRQDTYPRAASPRDAYSGRAASPGAAYPRRATYRPAAYRAPAPRPTTPI